MDLPPERNVTSVDEALELSVCVDLADFDGIGISADVDSCRSVSTTRFSRSHHSSVVHYRVRWIMPDAFGIHCARLDVGRKRSDAEKDVRSPGHDKLSQSMCLS